MTEFEITLIEGRVVTVDREANEQILRPSGIRREMDRTTNRVIIVSNIKKFPKTYDRWSACVAMGDVFR